jgi:predicted dehydrogenase
MNIGIIGAGFMGSMHARIIKDMPKVALVGVAARGADRVRLLAQDLGVRAYGDYRELIRDPAIDVVSVCTPTDTHAKIACEALDAGKHAIVEFPLCGDERELREIRDASVRTKRICAAAYFARYQGQYARVFDLARSGSLGTISNAFISRRSSSVFQSDDIVNNLISQDIDWVVRLLGMPKKVTCANDGQRYAAFTFTYKDKVAIIEGSTNMPKGYPFSTRHLVAGDRESVELSWRFTDRPEYRMELATDGTIGPLECEDYDPYRRELETILNAIGRGDAGGHDVHSVYDAARLSFECRRMMR